jgi:RNA polymerase sigma-70 factor (ECF subfamily)
MEQTRGFDETVVVDRARHGDFRAFAELVERYEAGVFRLARHLTRSQGDAEEVLQRTFLEAYEGLGELPGGSEFHPWLIRIVVSQALMRPRPRKEDRAVSPDKPFEVKNGKIPDRALGSLRPVLRAVFVLRDMEGMCVEDTAAMLHMPARAVQRRLLRARLQLRERLIPYFAQGPGFPAPLRL